MPDIGPILIYILLGVKKLQDSTHFLIVLNLIFSLILFLHAGYFFLKGRLVDRWVMVLNGFAGLVSFSVYSIFFIDHLFFDILEDIWFRTYCIRPVYFFLLCVIIANTIRIGRTDAQR